LNGYFYTKSPYGNDKNMFKVETDIRNPSTTPYFADSVWVDAWPVETSLPARNLFDGDKFQGPMARFSIPRHASDRSAAVTNFDPKNTLPGAINAAFADNHVELVRLENLWNLTWHKNWKVPAVRPGK
jgi:prepilin-type processing-associated H-X9-DG protein